MRMNSYVHQIWACGHRLTDDRRHDTATWDGKHNKVLADAKSIMSRQQGGQGHHFHYIFKTYKNPFRNRLAAVSACISGSRLADRSLPGILGRV